MKDIADASAAEQAAALLFEQAMKNDADIKRLRQDNEDLRHALQWALSKVDDPKPDPFSDVLSRYAQDHADASRLAWPDQPENWS